MPRRIGRSNRTMKKSWDQVTAFVRIFAPLDRNGAICLYSSVVMSKSKMQTIHGVLHGGCEEALLPRVPGERRRTLRRQGTDLLASSVRHLQQMKSPVIFRRR